MIHNSIACITYVHKRSKKLGCNYYCGLSGTNPFSRVIERITRDLIETKYKHQEEGEEQRSIRLGRLYMGNVSGLTKDL